MEFFGEKVPFSWYFLFSMLDIDRCVAIKDNCTIIVSPNEIEFSFYDEEVGGCNVTMTRQSFASKVISNKPKTTTN